MTEPLKMDPSSDMVSGKFVDWLTPGGYFVFEQRVRISHDPF